VNNFGVVLVALSYRIVSYLIVSYLFVSYRIVSSFLSGIFLRWRCQAASLQPSRGGKKHLFFFFLISTRTLKRSPTPTPCQKQVENLTVAQVDDDGEQASILVHFSDGQACSFSRKTLLAELDQDMDVTLQAKEYFVPPVMLWNSSFVAPPLFSHADIVSGRKMYRLLSALLVSGIAVVEDVPTELGECRRFASLLSTPRDTEWGENFNVRTSPDDSNGSDNGGLQDLACE
jgi:hypothetical protein